MAHTRQEWRDAVLLRPSEDERGRTAAVSLSAFFGAIVLLFGWHSGHIENRVLVAIGVALLVAAVIQFVVFVMRRLRRSA